MNYQLPKLPYAYNALEPHIDTRTMEIHYTKHHQTYTDNLNKVLEKYPALQDEKLEDLLRKLEVQPFDEKDRKMFRNNAGGYLNHNLFWTLMDPKKELDEALTNELNKEWGSLEEFKKLFSQTAITHFGSGWAWLVRSDGKLKVYSLPNQDSPHMTGDKPIIGLDVWEHAYYLKYQNRRAEYVENWWNVLKIL